MVLLLHREITGYVKRAEETPELSHKIPVPNSLFLPVCAQSLYWVLSLSFGSNTLHSAFGLWPMFRNQCPTVRASTSPRAGECTNPISHSHPPAPGIRGFCYCCKQKYRAGPQVAPPWWYRLWERVWDWRFQGWVSSCSTRASQKAQGHMLCSCHA